MTPEQLGNLACLAINDEAARIVLKDAIEESGWEPSWIMPPEWAAILVGTPPWASAVAALILCGDWGRSWPVAERCLLPETDAELRARLLVYPSPWGAEVDEREISVASGARLDEIARLHYGMSRR
jgi:hypothetical protein